MGLVFIYSTSDVTALIDDIRFYPSDAQMTTFTFGKFNNITSITDANNITTNYDYDEFGRLKTVLDNDKNILNYYIYHYKINSNTKDTLINKND